MVLDSPPSRKLGPMGSALLGAFITAAGVVLVIGVLLF